MSDDWKYSWTPYAYHNMRFSEARRMHDTQDKQRFYHRLKLYAIDNELAKWRAEHRRNLWRNHGGLGKSFLL